MSEVFFFFWGGGAGLRVEAGLAFRDYREVCVSGG